MDSTTIPSALTQPTTLGSRVLLLVNTRRLKKWLWWCLAVLSVVVCVFIEFQTSILQSWIFTSTNERISFAIAEGASSSIAFPRPAPFDDRRGYAKHFCLPKSAISTAPPLLGRIPPSNGTDY